MKLIQKIIQVGFATCALASASLPALSWTVWPNVDFEWYANVGKDPGNTMLDERYPAPRPGYVWAPGQYARAPNGDTQWVAGRWVRDEYEQHIATFTVPAGAMVASGPTVLRDRDGNVIPTNPEAYPVDSARR